MHMPVSDRCRPGLSNFQTFMVVDPPVTPKEAGLLLEGEGLKSHVGGVSVDPALRMGMRLI